MRKYYFKSSEQQGDIFIQLRYYSPYNNDKCYEAIIILISPTGQVRQFIDNLTETEVSKYQETLQKSNESEFNTIQDQKTLNNFGTRKKLYDTYYGQWKEYFFAKKHSLENVRNSTLTNNWNYYDRLENEWRQNGIYEKREELKKMEEYVKQLNNISVSDIYREARHAATHDYVINRI